MSTSAKIATVIQTSRIARDQNSSRARHVRNLAIKDAAAAKVEPERIARVSKLTLPTVRKILAEVTA